MRSKQSYMDRALRHKDPRYARVLDKMGYGTRHIIADASPAPIPDPDEGDELAQLRAMYQEVMGKRPFHGWDAETLKAKMAEADQS